MGNVELRCCCCQIKFGSGQPKTPKKKNEQSHLLNNADAKTTTTDPTIANNFNPNPPVDVTQFNGYNNFGSFDPHGTQAYQNLGVTDLRQAPPKTIGHRFNPSVVVHSDVGSGTVGSGTVGHGRSSSYDSLGSSNAGMNQQQGGGGRGSGAGFHQLHGGQQTDQSQEPRRSTVADPFSDGVDDDDDDTTDLDSDFPTPQNGKNKNGRNDKQSKMNDMSKIMEDNQLIEDLNGIMNNSNNVNKNMNNRNNMTNSNNNKNNINRNNNNNNNNLQANHIMSDGITSTDFDSIDNEENILSATDVDEEDKMLHDQSSDPHGNSSNMGDSKRSSKKNLINLSGVDESDDTKQQKANANTNDNNNTKPPAKGSKHNAQETTVM